MLIKDYYLKNSKRPKERVDLVLDLIPLLPLIPKIAVNYARIRTYLEGQGTPIGGNDLLIAIHALSFGLTVVTNNISEFSRVPNLRVQNWLDSD